MYHPRHHFSRRAPPCDHSRNHHHGLSHCDEYLDIIHVLHRLGVQNVAELEDVFEGAAMDDRECLHIEAQLDIMEYDDSILKHYHLLSPNWSPPWLRDIDAAMGMPMDVGRYGGGVYTPSGAPAHHYHGPPPSRGRDGRGVPYVEDTGSEASMFPGYRGAQARRGNQGRRGVHQTSDRDEEDRYETSPPLRRGGRRRRDEDEVEDSESDDSAPPPRRAGGGGGRRDRSPDVSERRTRVGARNRHDEDEESDDSTSAPPPPRRSEERRAGGNANFEERPARVEHTGQTNMHWQPGALRFEDVQELEGDEEGEEEDARPVKATKKGGKSGGGPKVQKEKPRDRY